MRPSFDQSISELLEAAADGGIENVVANLDGQSSQQGGIDLVREHWRGRKHSAELLLKCVALGVAQLDRRADQHPAAVLLAIPQLPRCTGYGDDQCETSAPVKHPEEPHC